MSLAVLRPDGAGGFAPAPDGSATDDSAPRVADLIGRGLVGRGLVSRASQRPVGTGVDQVFPVRTDLRPLLPWQGLRRGATVVVGDEPDPAPGSTSLLLGLISEAVRDGSWCGVVGIPALASPAAAEVGVELDRLALVPDPGADWVTVVAALLDGLDLVVVRPSGPVAPKLARRLAARTRQRGGVLVPYGVWEGADLTLRVTEQSWYGLEAGRGRLRSRRLSVVSYGRGSASRHRSAELWLPGRPGDAVTPVPTPAPGVPTPAPGVPAAGRDGPESGALGEAS